MLFDPLRSRNRAAALALIALAVFVPALVLPRSGDDLSVRKLVLFGSLGAMLISAVWWAVRWDEARRLLRLRAGEGIVARWAIDAQRWEGFRDRSLEWDRMNGVRPNDLDFAESLGAETAVDIIVSRDAILVGKRFYPLERTVRLTIRADWMEFHDVIPKPKGPPIHLVLRLPLAPGKEHMAAAIEDAYAQQTGESAGVGRGALIAVTLLCFVGIPLAAALAYWIAKLTGWVA